MNAPPLQPFNKKLMNTVVRGCVFKTIQESSLLVIDFTVQAVISSYPQLTSCFKEIRIKRVNVWMYTTLSAASSGTITLAVCPKDEINPSATPVTLATTPGSITRRVWQSLHAMYYPTEPDERNWFPIKQDKHLFVVQIIGKDLPKPGNSINPDVLDVQIVWDAHVELRGQAIVKGILPSRTYPPITEEFEVVNMN